MAQECFDSTFQKNSEGGEEGGGGKGAVRVQTDRESEERGRERERTSGIQRGSYSEDFGKGLHANKKLHRPRGVRGSKEYPPSGDKIEFDPKQIRGRSSGPCDRTNEPTRHLRDRMNLGSRRREVRSLRTEISTTMDIMCSRLCRPCKTRT